MKLKLDNQAKLITIVFIMILTFSSCKESEFNKVMFGEIEAESIIKPNEDQIKNDILNSKVGSWTFAKLEEFNNVAIVNSRVVDELNLDLEVTLDMSDYKTGKPYQGNVTVSYSRFGKNEDYWVFNDVSGTVSKVITEAENSQDVSPEINNQEEEEPQQSKMIICSNCNGTGEGYIKCPKDYWCKKGSIQKPNGDYAECSNCNGTGQVLGTCKVCHGNGRVKEYE